MARSTGSLDAQIDGRALSELVSAAKKISIECAANCTQIRNICNSMVSDEKLEGGASNEITDGFKAIAKGIDNLSNSMNHAAKIMDERLGRYINELNRNTTTSSAKETADAAAKKAGRFKKE